MKILATALALAFGCTAGPDPARCEPELALEIVHSRQGIPAFAGQALVITSCGAGAYCHTQGIEAADRFGAPAGLDFDLRPASTTAEPRRSAVARLGRDQERILAHAQLVWRSVEAGHMPPGGEVGAAYRANVPTVFERVDGTEVRPLPSLRSAEGRAILLEWLSCGAPVIERTVERPPGEPNAVGFTAPACERRCVEPSWAAIHEQVIAPSCALGRCHSSERAAGALVLDEGLTESLDRLLEARAAGRDCAPDAAPLLVPGDPEASLLWQKLNPSAATCGDPMPPSGVGPSAQALCAIRAWMSCGACADRGDPRCASCLDEARDECGFDPDQPSGCVVPESCSARLAD